MKFEISFNTSEEDGDNAVEILETVLLSAAHITIVKSNKGSFVSQNVRPTQVETIIDAEIIPDKPEEVIMVGSNIDTIV